MKFEFKLNKKNVIILCCVAFSLIVLTLIIALISNHNKPQAAEIDTDAVVEEVVIPEPIEEIEIVIEPIESIEPEVIEPKFINELSGLEIDEDKLLNRPFSVTLSNIETALPQFGLEEAEVLYEMLAEGGIPRLQAVFKDFTTDKIGPIRSARHYFYYLATDVNAIFVHYGKSPQALSLFQTGVEHLDGMSDLDSVMCYQDPNRKRPHSTFTGSELLYNGLLHRNYNTKISDEAMKKFTFSDTPVVLEGNAATQVKLPYSWFKPYFEYDEELLQYKRFQYSQAHIDANTDNQLVYDNLIIQAVKLWVIPGDTEGRLDMTLIGTGKGYYVTRGSYLPITWERVDYDSPTLYYYEDGTPVVINTGKTFISIFPDYNFEEITFQ